MSQNYFAPLCGTYWFDSKNYENGSKSMNLFWAVSKLIFKGSTKIG
jgi:hypothetical protein